MTWTPPGYVTSGTASSSQYNEECVDNLLDLNTRVNAITAATVLDPIPRAKGTRSSQIIPNSTWTAVGFTAEKYDKGGVHSTLSNDHRFTGVLAGLYHLSTGGTWDVSAAGMRFAQLRNQAGDVLKEWALPNNGAGAGVPFSLDVDHEMALNEWCALYVQHTHGSGLTLLNATMSARWVAPIA